MDRNSLPIKESSLIFADLAIHVGDMARLPGGHSASDFHSLTYHVQQGLLVHLMRECDNKHFLPDAAKLNVIFGPDGESTDFSCCLGVANVWINEIDFEEFFALNSDDQEQWVLGSGLSAPCFT